jgi:hypothetical protein
MIKRGIALSYQYKMAGLAVLRRSHTQQARRHAREAQHSQPNGHEWQPNEFDAFSKVRLILGGVRD